MAVANARAVRVKRSDGTWQDIAVTGPIGPVGPQGPKGDTGGNATVPMEPWHLVGTASEPAFGSGWVNFGGAEQVAGFRKDPLGKVQLRGVIKSGTVPSAAFVLPVGYRPPMNVRFPLISSAAVTGYVQVTGSTGAVSVESGSNNWVDLAAVEFDTDTVTEMTIGPQGVQGVAGPQGPIGPQGVPGITVSTVPPVGTPASDGLLWVVVAP